MPLLVVPEVNDNMPLTPVVPAFMVFTITAPLVSVVPSPVAIDTAPPLKGKLCPAVTTTSPPGSVFDLPIDTRISPPSPCVALPVAIWMYPEPPFDAVPDVKLKCPLTPLVPASSVCTTTLPLDVAVPSPVVSETAPPVKL